jgi:hypothetical protein
LSLQKFILLVVVLVLGSIEIVLLHQIDTNIHFSMCVLFLFLNINGTYEINDTKLLPFVFQSGRKISLRMWQLYYNASCHNLVY